MTTPTPDSEQYRRISRRGLLKTTAGATALSLAGVAAGEPADEPTPVEDWHDLADIREKPYGDYRLVADLDAETAGYDEHVDTDDGWQPIGTPESEVRYLSRTSRFTGRFDGNGHTIRDLRVDRPDTDNVGLFGRIGVTGTVERLELADATVVGSGHVGALVGSLQGDLRLCAVDADVTGGYRVGGIAGRVEDGTVRACRATGAVGGGGTMTVTVGGLVGWLQAGTVSESFEAVQVDNASGRVVGADGTDLDKSDVVRLEDVYWDESTSESVRTTGITNPDRAAVELQGDVESLAAEETRGASARGTMSGLDFENTWTTIPGEYPQLQVLAEPAPEPTEIDDWRDLAAVSQDLAGEYRLVTDLDRTLLATRSTSPATRAGSRSATATLRSPARSTGTATRSVACASTARTPQTPASSALSARTGRSSSWNWPTRRSSGAARPAGSWASSAAPCGSVRSTQTCSGGSAPAGWPAKLTAGP